MNQSNKDHSTHFHFRQIHHGFQTGFHCANKTRKQFHRLLEDNRITIIVNKI